MHRCLQLTCCFGRGMEVKIICSRLVRPPSSSQSTTSQISQPPPSSSKIASFSSQTADCWLHCMNCWNEMNSRLCKYGYVFCIAFESDNWTIGVSEHWRGVSRCISRYGLVFCICICIRISKQWVDVSRCGFGSSSHRCFASYKTTAHVCLLCRHSYNWYLRKNIHWYTMLFPTRRPTKFEWCSHSYNWDMMTPYLRKNVHIYNIISFKATAHVLVAQPQLYIFDWYMMTS